MAKSTKYTTLIERLLNMPFPKMYALVVLIFCTVLPGTLMILFFKPHILSELSPIKVLVVSFGLTAPFYSYNFIGLHSKLQPLLKYAKPTSKSDLSARHHMATHIVTSMFTGLALYLSILTVFIPVLRYPLFLIVFLSISIWLRRALSKGIVKYIESKSNRTESTD